MPLPGVVPFPPDFARHYREKGYWQDKSLAQEFAAVFRKYAERVALIDGEREFTYAEIDRVTDNLALNLLELERQVVGDAVDLRVRELALAVDERDALGVFAEDRGEFLRERLVLPVALLAIVTREVGREGHYA